MPRCSGRSQAAQRHGTLTKPAVPSAFAGTRSGMLRPRVPRLGVPQHFPVPGTSVRGRAAGRPRVHLPPPPGDFPAPPVLPPVLQMLCSSQTTLRGTASPKFSGDRAIQTTGDGRTLNTAASRSTQGECSLITFPKTITLLVILHLDYQQCWRISRQKMPRVKTKS